MKVSEWLSNLEYNTDGMTLEKEVNGSTVVILDIRGWSTIVNSLGSENKAALFQDEVGRFVLEAINEKLENDKGIENAWKKIKEVLEDTDFIEKSVNYNTKLGEVVVKFYKYCKKNNTKESEKFQINNLDWCKLILNEDKTVDVENEHNSRYSIIDLDVEELDIILQLL